MKKVLVIAYGFPPVGGAGVQRPVKFVKYLRDFGWEPLVLTVENPSVPVLDSALLKDIPEGIRIYRAKTLEPSYTAKQAYKSSMKTGFSGLNTLKKIISACMLPDLQLLWWPGMLIRLFQVVRHEKPECIFVTAPPFSSFVPAVALGRLFGIPVVLDYRDGWMFSRRNWEQSNKSRLAYHVDAVLERFALNNCRGFTAASQYYVADITHRYGQYIGSKGETITNGYDPDDFSRNMHEEPAYSGNNQLTIVYAGTVWNATSMINFAAALVKLLTERPALKEQLCLHIYGRIVDSERDCLDAEALRGVVHCHGYVDHEQVIRKIDQADVLLITLSDLPGTNGIITAKAFEYMASGKHIFAVVPEGETRDILQKNYNKLTLADAGVIEDIYNGLLWVQTHPDEVRNAIPADVSRFSRISLTGKLATVLDRAIQGNP